MARVLKNMKPMREREPTDLIYYSKLELWENLVRELTDFCHTYNSNFNRYKFFTACGMDDDDDG
jgi:hypothetical protein